LSNEAPYNKPGLPPGGPDDPAGWSDELASAGRRVGFGRTGPRKEGSRSVVLGVGLAVVLQVLQIVAIAVSPAAWFFVGATQIAYILPAVLIALVKGRLKLALGLLIGASLVFLLNAATCAGLLFTNRNGF
jgi:hypothetical protein